VTALINDFLPVLPPYSRNEMIDLIMIVLCINRVYYNYRVQPLVLAALVRVANTQSQREWC
jgi:hypothetical protein